MTLASSNIKYAWHNNKNNKTKLSKSDIVKRRIISRRITRYITFTCLFNLMFVKCLPNCCSVKLKCCVYYSEISNNYKKILLHVLNFCSTYYIYNYIPHVITSFLKVMFDENSLDWYHRN